MLRPKMLPAAVWHEKLAEIHAAPSNLEGKRSLLLEVEKLEKKAEAALASKRHLERLKAAPLLNEARKKRFIAGAVGSSSDAEAHVKHTLAAAQIRASAENRNVTLAAHIALQKLLASSDPLVVAAVKRNTTTKLLGISTSKELVVLEY